MEAKTRIFKAAVSERAAEGDKPTAFVGVPVVFNQLSEDLGGFREIISPRAWDTAILDDCFAVFNHKEDNLLATYKAGTLRFLPNDENGVNVEIDQANTTISRDCSEWVRRKEVDKMSFKFTLHEDGEEWMLDAEDNLIRTITKFDRIYDVSLVTRPAYTGTSIRSGFEPSDLAEIRAKLLGDTANNPNQKEGHESRSTPPAIELKEADSSEYEYYAQLHIYHKHKLK
jgi:hypothetical protein